MELIFLFRNTETVFFFESRRRNPYFVYCVFQSLSVF